MTDNLTKEECILLLQEKYKKLNRLPQKSDFSVTEVARIKAFFKAFARALEAAGIKEERPYELLKRREDKQIRAKVRIRERKLEQKNKNQD